MSEFSGYRFMWTVVMFDLPVVTKPQRRRATKFRNELLNLGFEMAQFSVYMKFSGSRSAVDALAYRIRSRIPPEGNVSILALTDKQYGQMQVFNGGARQERDTSRGQLLLF